MQKDPELTKAALAHMIRAFHALAVDDRRRLPMAGSSQRPAAAQHGAWLSRPLELGWNARPHPPRPLREVSRKCRARRKPDGGKNIHHAVHDIAHDNRSSAARRALLAGSWVRPAPILRRSGCLDSEACCGRIKCGSHSSTSAPPANRIGARESQPIQCLQHVFGRTLSRNC